MKSLTVGRCIDTLPPPRKEALPKAVFFPVIATDGAGAVFLAGAPFSNSLAIHGGSSVSGDLILAKLDAAGALLWAKGFGQGGQSTIESIDAIAVDTAGNVILTGAIEGIVDFGGGALPYVDDGNGLGDIFAAKLDPQGAHIQSATFGEGKGRAATVDAAGSVLFAGTVKGHADFGHGEYQTGSSVFDEGFLVKLAW